MSAAYALASGYSPTTSTELASIVEDKHYQPNALRRPVIASHFSIGNSYIFAQTSVEGRHIIQRIAERGMPVHVPDEFSLSNFGNPASVVRVGESHTDIKRPRWNPKQDKAGLFSVSMGILPNLNWARANPTKVSAIAGVIPPPNLKDLHDNRGFEATIDSAQAYTNHAGYLAAQPTSDPAATGNQAALAGIPIVLWVSEDDPAAVPSVVRAYAASVNAAGGSCEVRSLGSVGHTSVTLDPEEVAEFFLAHA